ncbi:MAG TPA: TetR family transcriptional regulator [Acetobacteraceae bacterium]|nr:TetR family transcriptional regulator [Acetobacteraceae bacterium]
MSEEAFEHDLVAAAFSLAAQQGWHRVSAAAAARHAELDLAEARRAFPHPWAILARFGQMADSYALKDALTDGVVKDRLFDILMRRVDFHQQHRAGVLALGQAMPLNPALAAWLARRTLSSMGWMLEGAGISASGFGGELRKRGLALVWAWTMRAWTRDESEELSATMAALDSALVRADQCAAQFRNAPSSGRTAPEAVPDAPFESPAENPDRPE